MKALLVSEYTSVRSLRIQEVPSQDASKSRWNWIRRVIEDRRSVSDQRSASFRARNRICRGRGSDSGSHVSRLQAGDRVFGFASRGARAEEITVPVGELSQIPDYLSFAQAAAVPVNYLTAAYGLMELGELCSGQNLLILGAAGGTGTAAINIG